VGKKKAAGFEGRPLAEKPKELLGYVFLRRIALGADFAFLGRLHAAGMFAGLASGFGLVAAGFSAGEGGRADKGQGAGNDNEGLDSFHLFYLFLPVFRPAAVFRSRHSTTRPSSGESQVDELKRNIFARPGLSIGKWRGF
jgi:hypothetical protein